jgi:serine/threonine-protein kinase
MKTFGKYQLFEEIGKSPAGTTYRAIDQLSGRAVAVKTLNSADLGSEVKARLCHTLTACAELQHPNIARILDTGEIDGTIYVATELLHGLDLRRYLQAGQKLTLARKLRIMGQVYDGLALAHRKQIVHGGIKPANVFLAEQDETRRNEGKILDFGIAKLSGQPADVASDLFAAAAVLYEFITGVAPFETPVEPKRLRKVDPQVPEELDCLIASALSKDPQQRPQTAEIMAASLCAIAGKLPQTAEPVGAKTVPVSAPLAATAAAGASSAVVAQPVPIAVSKPEPVASAAPQPAREVSSAAGKAEPATASPSQTAPVQGPNAKIAPAPIGQKEPAVPAAAVAKRSPVRVGIVVGAAAILALFIMAGLLSKQTSKATPSSQEIQAPPAVSAPSENVTPVSQPPAIPAQAIAEERKPAAADQILAGQVQALWESGEYARALTLVDAILAAEPENAEGLAWKKKIHTAQQAEAALR